MKLVVDIPSLAVGMLAGLVLSFTPFGAHWIFDYSGTSATAAAAAAAFLAGTAVWLLAFAPHRPPPPPPTFDFNSFTVAPRPRSGPEAALEPALRPMEWLAAHGCADAGWREGSERAFAGQLTGAGERDDIVRAVSAVMAAADPARELDNLALVVEAADGLGIAPDFAAFAGGLERRDGAAWAPRLAETHHYAATRLVAAVETARRRGRRVACASLRWLKGRDRALWYALNNAGRPAMFVEGAGISAHFAAEKKAGRALAEPDVAAAVDGLEDYLKKHRGGGGRTRGLSEEARLIAGLAKKETA